MVATEHSSTRTRFPIHHFLNVSLQIANKVGNLKKKLHKNVLTVFWFTAADFPGVENRDYGRRGSAALTM
jgi:hypothetical protein